MGFEDTWADATTDGSDDNAPPDGTHDVALIDADAFTSKKGDDFVKLSFKTVDNQYCWDFIGGFKSVKAAGFTKGQCEIIGVNVDDVSSLDELAQELKQHVSSFYEVEVQREGDYVNTYVRDGAAAATPDVPADTSDFAPAGAGSQQDDDLPF